MKANLVAILSVVFLALISWPVVGMPAPSKTTVAQAQARLQALGYDPGPLDGRWGAKMAAAVSKFQQAQGLPVTGELDKATQEKLGVAGSPSDGPDTSKTRQSDPRDAKGYLARGESSLLTGQYAQALADIVQFERLDDGGDQLHGWFSSGWIGAATSTAGSRSSSSRT